ncbi:hypothetical protein F7R12_30145 [Pseudomonas tolaasii]|nr:hypothetical protein F7R12_30145 [Pseudomonas tolaasii]
MHTPEPALKCTSKASPASDPLWERVCPRYRYISQYICRLICRHRGQARSHRGFALLRSVRQTPRPGRLFPVTARAV